MIGAGDCPYCGGDVVFDLRGGRASEEEPPGFKRLRRRLIEALRR